MLGYKTSVEHVESFQNVPFIQRLEENCFDVRDSQEIFL